MLNGIAMSYSKRFDHFGHGMLILIGLMTSYLSTPLDYNCLFPPRSPFPLQRYNIHLHRRPRLQLRATPKALPNLISLPSLMYLPVAMKQMGICSLAFVLTDCSRQFLLPAPYNVPGTVRLGIPQKFAN